MAKHRKRGGSGRPPGEYVVGYRKPPKEHQFQKNAPSPNPYGRGGKKPKPEMAESEAPDFLDGFITVGENGRPKTMTRDEAIDHALFGQAMKGNVQAARLLIERQAQRWRARKEAKPMAPDESGLSPEDEAGLARYILREAKRLARGGEGWEGGND